jgi:hypothetical protein
MRSWPKSLKFDREPVAVLLPEPLASEVRALLASDQYVEAVRRVRQRTRLNLLPAVLAVDAVRAAAQEV